jgi:hypothetical protein
MKNKNPLAEWLAPLPASVSLDKMVALAISKLRALSRSATTGGDVLTFCEAFQSRFHSLLMREALSGCDATVFKKRATIFYGEVDSLFGHCFNVRAFLESEEDTQRERLEKAQREYEAARARRLAGEEKSAQFYEMVRRASGFEKEGNLEAAASIYEDGLRLCSAAGFGVGHRRSCWERLFIVYRKQRRLSDEEALLIDAISQMAAKSCPASMVGKYEERLRRCRSLLAQSQSPGF